MSESSDKVRKAAEELWNHDRMTVVEIESLIESHCHVTEMEAVIEKCREALVPFASKDECEIGVIVGTHSDEQCQECDWIMKAREALSSIDALKGDKR